MKARLLRLYVSACSAHFLVQMLLIAIRWGAGPNAMLHSPVGRALSRAEFWLTHPFVPMLHRVGLDALAPFAWLPNSFVWGAALLVASLPAVLRR